jgi:O-acetyl-ADP-ribose deacetylase (regulator of RNase III)
MIKIVQGNILNASENIICQQVNCKGVMNAGIAKQIRDKYPNIYIEYQRYCLSHPKDKLLGKVFIYPIDYTSKYICCIFGQDNFGRTPNTVYTSYKALREGFQTIKNEARKNNLTIAIPYGIGCGLAGGSWNMVYTIIKNIFDDYDAMIYRLEK